MIEKFTLQEDAHGHKNPILPEGVKNYLIDIDARTFPMNSPRK